MYEIIAIIIAAFRTDTAEDFLRAELAPYIDTLSKFTMILPIVASVTSLLMRSAGKSPTAQAEVTDFIVKLGDVLHDLSEPKTVADPTPAPVTVQAAEVKLDAPVIQVQGTIHAAAENVEIPAVAATAAEVDGDEVKQG